MLAPYPHSKCHGASISVDFTFLSNLAVKQDTKFYPMWSCYKNPRMKVHTPSQNLINAKMQKRLWL